MEVTLNQALKKAVESHRAGQIKEADHLYSTILKSYPKHPDANHNMGLLGVGAGRIQEALPYFKTALEANPKIDQYWLSYIDALIKLGRIVDAKAEVDQAKYSGASSGVLEQLAVRLSSTIISAAKSANPDPEKLRSIVNSLIEGKLLHTLSQATEMLEQFPHSPILYDLSGAANAGLRQFDAAIENYSMALKIGPDSAEIYNNMGIALSNTGDLKAAIKSFKQALRVNPAFAEAHSNMGNVLKNQGDLQVAIDSFKQAIKINPDVAAFYYNISEALYQFGDVDAAISSLKQGVKINPENAEAQTNLGNLLQANSLHKEARECFDKVTRIFAKKGLRIYETNSVESQSSNSITHNILDTMKLDMALKLAQQRLEDGQVEQAKSVYEDILQKLPDNKKSLTSLQLIAEGPTSVIKGKSLEELTSSDVRFLKPRPIEYEELYRPGMGTDNVGGLLRSMVQMVRPSRILEVGAGYTTPFLLEAIVNNMRVFNDGTLNHSYFSSPYVYEPKLVVIDDMTQGELSEKPGMEAIIKSEYVDFVQGRFQDKAGELLETYGSFDFVWLDCGGEAEYKVFMDKYWEMCNHYILFHFTYSDGQPNVKHNIILDKIAGNPLIFDIVEPHKNRQGSITMVRKH